MNRSFSSYFSIGLALFLGLCLWLYIGYRAAIFSFAHDEAITFTYMKWQYWQIAFSEDCFQVPNNHIFNTLLTKICYQILGDSEFALRLPNVCAFLLFFYAGFRLIYAQTQQPLFVLGALSLLFFNAYMLDFFSLCRGYGLSMAFELYSFWLLYQWLMTEKINYWRGAIIAGFFCVYANFSALLLFLVMISIVPGYYFYKQRKEPDFNPLFRQVSMSSLIGFLSVVAFMAKPIEILRIKGQFKYGNPQFWASFIEYLQDFLYFQENILIFYLFFFSTLSFVGYLLYKFFIFFQTFSKIKDKQEIYFFIITCIFLSQPLLSIVQHYLLKSAYPEHRTLSMYAVLLQLLAAFTWIKFIKKQAILGLIPFLYTLFFLSVANLNYIKEWYLDRDTRQMMWDLQKELPKDSKIKLGVHWFFEPAANFYKQKYHLTNFDTLYFQPTLDTTGKYEYYYLSEKDAKPLKNQYQIVKRYVRDCVLMKKRREK